MSNASFRAAAGLPDVLQLPVGSLPMLEQRSEEELRQLREAVERALEVHEARMRKSLRWLPGLGRRARVDGSASS